VISVSRPLELDEAVRARHRSRGNAMASAGNDGGAAPTARPAAWPGRQDGMRGGAVVLVVGAYERPRAAANASRRRSRRR
jgi:hypothetical protein